MALQTPKVLNLVKVSEIPSTRCPSARPDCEASGLAQDARSGLPARRTKNCALGRRAQPLTRFSLTTRSRAWLLRFSHPKADPPPADFVVILQSQKSRFRHSPAYAQTTGFGGQADL